MNKYKKQLMESQGLKRNASVRFEYKKGDTTLAFSLQVNDTVELTAFKEMLILALADVNKQLNEHDKRS